MEEKTIIKGISVISNDTNICPLLHHNNAQIFTGLVNMEVSIKTCSEHPCCSRTASEHHSWSGRDTYIASVWHMHDTKKISVMKIFCAGLSLGLLKMQQYSCKANRIHGRLLWTEWCFFHAEARQKSWTTIMGTETLYIDCKVFWHQLVNWSKEWGHLQASVWKHAVELDPPPLDPLLYGLLADKQNL